MPWYLWRKVDHQYVIILPELLVILHLKKQQGDSFYVVIPHAFLGCLVTFAMSILLSNVDG